MSRDELIVLVGVQADQIAGRDARIAAQDVQIAAMAMRMAELRDANGALADRLAKLEHLMSCNSKNSSSPPFKDDGPDNTPLSGTTGHGNRLGEHKARLLLEISHDRPG